MVFTKEHQRTIVLLSILDYNARSPFFFMVLEEYVNVYSLQYSRENYHGTRHRVSVLTNMASLLVWFPGGYGNQPSQGKRWLGRLT